VVNDDGWSWDHDRSVLRIVRYPVTRFDQILDVKLSGFADIGQGLFRRVSPGMATFQSRAKCVVGGFSVFETVFFNDNLKHVGLHPSIIIRRSIIIRSTPSACMFTGIIEELGTVVSFEPRPAGARLRVRCSGVLSDLAQGASIAVNGVCLTALDIAAGSFAADLAPETLERSNLGALTAGSRVNLERPVTPATRLSGHIVQGHVDATGVVEALDELGGGNWWLKLRVPAALDRYLVHKGSIAIDGISLTIAALEAGLGAAHALVSVTIIPHTIAHTTLGFTKPGARLNVEVDVLAKHVEKLLTGTQAVPSSSP
jgi:riboflavin synthase